jgi:flagellar motor switch protein FliG
MVNLDGAAPEVVRAVEGKMMQALSSALALRHEVSPAGGLASLVSLLKSSDRATEHEILQSLGEVDPALVEAIKQQMFVFENIVQLDDRSIQRVLRDVDSRDLMVALKGAPENVRRTVMRNMSSRASATLEDDLATMGPVRLSAVQTAQGNIVTVIRRLDEAEEIVISRGDVVG